MDKSFNIKKPFQKIEQKIEQKRNERKQRMDTYQRLSKEQEKREKEIAKWGEKQDKREKEMDEWHSEYDQTSQNQTNRDSTAHRLSKLEAVQLFKDSYDRLIAVYKGVHDPLRDYDLFFQELNNPPGQEQDAMRKTIDKHIKNLQKMKNIPEDLKDFTPDTLKAYLYQQIQNCNRGIEALTSYKNNKNLGSDGQQALENIKKLNIRIETVTLNIKRRADKVNRLDQHGTASTSASPTSFQDKLRSLSEKLSSPIEQQEKGEEITRSVHNKDQTMPVNVVCNLDSTKESLIDQTSQITQLQNTEMRRELDKFTRLGEIRKFLGEIRKFLEEHTDDVCWLKSLKTYQVLSNHLKDTDSLLEKDKINLPEEHPEQTESLQSTFKKVTDSQTALLKHFNKIQEIIKLKETDKEFGKVVETFATKFQDPSSQPNQEELGKIRKAYLEAFFTSHFSSLVKQKGHSLDDKAWEVLKFIYSGRIEGPKLRHMIGSSVAHVQKEFAIAFGKRTRELAEQTPARDTTQTFQDTYRHEANWEVKDNIKNLYVAVKIQGYTHIERGGAHRPPFQFRVYPTEGKIEVARANLNVDRDQQYALKMGKNGIIHENDITTVLNMSEHLKHLLAFLKTYPGTENFDLQIVETSEFTFNADTMHIKRLFGANSPQYVDWKKGSEEYDAMHMAPNAHGVAYLINQHLLEKEITHFQVGSTIRAFIKNVSFSEKGPEQPAN